MKTYSSHFLSLSSGSRQVLLAACLLFFGGLIKSDVRKVSKRLAAACNRLCVLGRNGLIDIGGKI